jgi:DNA-binding transcriptional regulator LsrR (DeoR family)
MLNRVPYPFYSSALAHMTLMNVESRLLKFAVAKLLSERQPGGRPPTQQEVAKRLGIRQSKVSRIIQGLIEKQEIEMLTVVTPMPSITETPQWSQMEELLTGDPQVDKIRDEIAASTPYREVFRLEVVDSFRSDNPVEFGRTAAPIVTKLLRNAGRIGVGCGRSIDAVVRSLPPLAPTGRSRTSKLLDLRIVPIIGEPNHLQNRDQDRVYSASLVAEAMQQSLLGKTDPSMPVLRGVPAYVARRFRTNEVRQMFEEIPGFHEIFGGPASEAEHLDCVITGVGIVAPESRHEKVRGTMIKEYLEQEGKPFLKAERVTAKQLDAWTVGQISGILLPRFGIHVPKIVNQLNDGLTGLRERHLRMVCERADQASGSVKPPGCIVLAFGDRKVSAVANAIRRGIVTTLVTTRDFAERLSGQLRSQHENGE